MTIFSNGWWIALVLNETSHSEVFSLYLSKMNNWLISNRNLDCQKLVIILDNWSYHKSKKSKELRWLLIEKLLFVCLLSFIGSHWACIFEKKNLIDEYRRYHLNLKTKGSKQKILKWMMKLNKSKILKNFKHFYSKIKLNLSL